MAGRGETQRRGNIHLGLKCCEMHKALGSLHQCPVEVQDPRAVIVIVTCRGEPAILGWFFLISCFHVLVPARSFKDSLWKPVEDSDGMVC